MTLSLDPEIAEALAPMAGAMAEAKPPAVGDMAGRRAMWEPIIGAAGAAQPIVPVEFHVHPGVPHEFDSIAFGTDVARRAIADRVRVLKSI
ncbi:hypothetical protein ACH4E5_31330 [Streptomyces afghaniensis]|uniref:hypothetical protein n=1 Tax=Streptomyces afghaniensis TaxID=66865 RepID=UPI00378DFF98